MQTWDIFCRVVDNYGDIGVCWRLARQLAAEHSCQVRLWVDDIEALRRIWPGISAVSQQIAEQVDIRVWPTEFDSTIEPADVVIEAFACEIPATYLKAMKESALGGKPPCWFNLDYLSAEDWVEGCHALLSTHPQLGLKKAFYFPGFTQKTGGLLRERQLLETRDCFRARGGPGQLLARFGVTPSADALVVSLFGYENPAISSLLYTWAESPQPILCLVPEGRILADIEDCLSQSLSVGDQVNLGALRLCVIPFVSQLDYDQLLWSCDINFVRGEDSFVRAQWAGKPLIWQIYPQDDGVHMDKLEAFLKRYLANAEPALQAPVTYLWTQWNSLNDCNQAWNDCLAKRQEWDRLAEDWCQRLNSLADLASNMVHFCQKTL
jgi:uncharacterized repeat protein (TIGR03837 family)